MILRKSQDRGQFKSAWLKSAHTFSFGEYHDPRFMGFHDLRVINEDTVQPGQGFATHGHRDMEILTYVFAGTVAHRDSMGNEEFIPAGEVQIMSAGRGVQHSEFNPSSVEPLKLLQIWVQPNARGLPPSYDQRKFSRSSKINRLCLLASPDGRDQSLPIHQEVLISGSILEPQHSLNVNLPSGQALWLQLIHGALKISGPDSSVGFKTSHLSLTGGDAVASENSGEFQISAPQESEFLLFQLKKRSHP